MTQLAKEVGLTEEVLVAAAAKIVPLAGNVIGTNLTLEWKAQIQTQALSRSADDGQESVTSAATGTASCATANATEKGLLHELIPTLNENGERVLKSFMDVYENNEESGFVAKVQESLSLTRSMASIAQDTLEKVSQLMSEVVLDWIGSKQTCLDLEKRLGSEREAVRKSYETKLAKMAADLDKATVS